MNIKLIIILFTVFMMSCKDSIPSSPVQKGTAFVLLDYTEGQEYSVSFDRVKSWADKIGTNIESIEVMPIRDQSLSTYDIIDLSSHIDAHGSSFLESQAAQDALNKGTEKLSVSVQAYNTKYSGKELAKSSIVNPLCDCLKKSGNNDIVFLFSDILENDFGINYRDMSPEDISKHLNGTCRSNTTIIAVVEAFRDSDDGYVREAIKGYEASFPNFKYTTSL